MAQYGHSKSSGGWLDRGQGATRVVLTPRPLVFLSQPQGVTSPLIQWQWKASALGKDAQTWKEGRCGEVRSPEASLESGTRDGKSGSTLPLPGVPEAPPAKATGLPHLPAKIGHPELNRQGRWQPRFRELVITRLHHIRPPLLPTKKTS